VAGKFFVENATFGWTVTAAYVKNTPKTGALQQVVDTIIYLDRMAF